MEKIRYKTAVVSLLIATLIIMLSVEVAAASHGGKHVGEKPKIEYEIEFLDYKDVDEGGYPIYFIGQPMHFRITITNTGERTFNNLFIRAIQEYHENMSGNDTGYFEVHKGEMLPGDAVSEWYFEGVRGGETITLDVYYTSPLETHPGLNQVHLEFYHWKPPESSDHGFDAPGRLFIDDPEAGVYCPHQS